MLVTKFNCPNPRASAQVEDSFDLGIREVRGRKTKLVVESEEEQIMLQV